MKKLDYSTPDIEVLDLGVDLITTSREWDTEEMPINQTEESSPFVW